MALSGEKGFPESRDTRPRPQRVSRSPLVDSPSHHFLPISGQGSFLGAHDLHTLWLPHRRPKFPPPWDARPLDCAKHLEVGCSRGEPALSCLMAAAYGRQALPSLGALGPLALAIAGAVQESRGRIPHLFQDSRALLRLWSNPGGSVPPSYRFSLLILDPVHSMALLRLSSGGIAHR